MTSPMTLNQEMEMIRGGDIGDFIDLIWAMPATRAALSPYGLSPVSRSQAKPTAAIAKGDK